MSNRSEDTQDKNKLAPGLLADALQKEAQVRGHAAKEVADVLNVHPSHWYRLRRTPDLFQQCEHRTLERVAGYLRWPLGRVYFASGVLQPADFEALGSANASTAEALARLRRSPFIAALRTPLEAAASDHQSLFAELFVATEQAALQAARLSGDA